MTTKAPTNVISHDAVLEIKAELGDTGLNGYDAIEQIVKHLQELMTRFGRTDDIEKAYIPIYRHGEIIGQINVAHKAKR